MKNQQNTYFDVLQIFRGIAAIMVVVCHITLSYRHFGALENKFLFALGNYGAMGVDFFFILSGFIICYSTFIKHNTINKYNKFRNYIVNRILRIYIPYLLIGILMLILYSLICFALFTFFAIHFAINYMEQINFKTKKFILPLLVGNASYSIYLIHNPTISIVDRIIPFTNNDSVNLLRFALVLIICCVAGIAYYFIFEKVLYKKVRLLVNSLTKN